MPQQHVRTEKPQKLKKVGLKKIHEEHKRLDLSQPFSFDFYAKNGKI